MADETLEQIFEKIGSGDDGGENNSTETLDTTPDTEDRTPDTEPEADNAPSATGDEDSVRATLEELRQQHPPEVVDAIHKRLDAEMKRGVTPRLQEAAELKRRVEAYEGISPEQANWFRSLNTLAVQNPQQAAAALQQEIDRLNSLGQPASPYLDPQYMTDTERAMHTQIQAQQQQLAELTAANNRVEMSRQFEGLEKKYSEIPFEEREAVMKRVFEIGGAPQLVPMVWKDMFMDKVLQRERDKTSKTVQRKAGMSPAPSSVANRAGSAPRDVGEMTLEEAIAASVGSD